MINKNNCLSSILNSIPYLTLSLIIISFIQLYQQSMNKIFLVYIISGILAAFLDECVIYYLLWKYDQTKRTYIKLGIFACGLEVCISFIIINHIHTSLL